MSKRRKLWKARGASELNPEHAMTLDDNVPSAIPDPTAPSVPFLTSIAQLVAIDDALYGPKGLLSLMIRHERREELFEQGRKDVRTGLESRQRLLDIGAQEFGMKALTLSDSVPGLLSPSGNPEEAGVTYRDLRKQLEDGYALVLGEPEHLSLVELVLKHLGPHEASNDGLRVVVGFVPWAYAFVARKTPGFRNAVSINDEGKWKKGVAFEMIEGHKGLMVRAVTLPDDVRAANDLLQWLLLEVIHQHLFVPSDLRDTHAPSRSLFDRGATPHGTRADPVEERAPGSVPGEEET